MAPLPQDVEREALELAPKLAHSLRLLMPRLSELPPVRQARPDYRPSLLTPVVATRLAQLADSLNMPPQAPIAIGVRTFRQELLTPALARR
jgi:hypothetical protein